MRHRTWTVGQEGQNFTLAPFSRSPARRCASAGLGAGQQPAPVCAVLQNRRSKQTQNTDFICTRSQALQKEEVAGIPRRDVEPRRRSPFCIRGNELGQPFESWQMTQRLQKLTGYLGRLKEAPATISHHPNAKPKHACSSKNATASHHRNARPKHHAKAASRCPPSLLSRTTQADLHRSLLVLSSIAVRGQGLTRFSTGLHLPLRSK